MKKISKLKKAIKVIFLATLIIGLIGSYILYRAGLRMYGGLTERVDSTELIIELESRPKTFAIRNVNVLSIDAETMIQGQTVLIENGIIKAIDSTINLNNSVKMIDGAGKYLIPGLTDAHIHLWKSRNDLLLYLANGVTQIRELIGDEEILSWKEDIKSGKLLGPDMFVATPRLGSFGAMEGWFMSTTQGFDNVSTAKEAEKAVREYIDKGYDGIKVYSQLNRESYDAINETAKSLNFPVMGHIPFEIGMADIYQSYQTDISHFEEIMNALNREFGYYNGGNSNEFLAFVDKRCEQIADSLKKHKITVTSTLYGTENLVNQKYDIENALREVALEYVNPGLVEWSKYAPGGPGWLPEVNMYRIPDNLNLTPEEFEGRKQHWLTYMEVEHLVAEKMIENGVSIMSGTDAGIPLKVAGFSLHDEFESLSNAGMSNAQILQSTTSIPSDWMKMNTGKIAVGRKANLVLLDNNPLLDIKHTKSINTVILNGKILDRAFLDKILLAVKEANNKSRKESIDNYIK